jgi:hypothetical protein
MTCQAARPFHTIRALYLAVVATLAYAVVARIGCACNTRASVMHTTCWSRPRRMLIHVMPSSQRLMVLHVCVDWSHVYSVHGAGGAGVHWSMGLGAAARMNMGTSTHF